MGQVKERSQVCVLGKGKNAPCKKSICPCKKRPPATNKNKKRKPRTQEKVVIFSKEALGKAVSGGTGKSGKKGRFFTKRERGNGFNGVADFISEGRGDQRRGEEKVFQSRGRTLRRASGEGKKNLLTRKKTGQVWRNTKINRHARPKKLLTSSLVTGVASQRGNSGNFDSLSGGGALSAVTSPRVGKLHR